MIDNLKVSIITPTYNCAGYIERCIQSVIRQSYENIEYVIIDGGSTDGTLDLVKKHSEHIDYFISEKDDGIFNAMNKGIKNSTGDVLFFLNADDRYCDDEVVTYAMSYLNNDPGLEMVYGNVILEMPAGQVKWTQHKTLSRMPLALGTISHQSIFAKRNLFEKTNGFSEKYKIVGDFDWLMKLAHSDTKSLHIERDITFVCVEGLSHTTEWEHERIQAMREFYTWPEIIFWRVIPRKIGKSLKKIKKFIKSVT